jgi:NAD(P)-dependent dehydrogenase (short-subunit alcohol dehydrogenase family)
MTFSEGLFHGRKVLVIGGTSGIGAGIAAAFVAAGAQVHLTGATAADLALAADDPALQGARTLALDVRDAAAVEAVVAGAGTAEGAADVTAGGAGLDVLVNCAGMIRRGEELQPEVFAAVLDVNLNGTMRACAAARPLLATRKGCIINIASMLSFFGGGLVPAYSASKGGVAQLTKSLAIAYADDGIRVNALAPGWIATRFTAALQDDASRSQAILARTPMKRWGTPEDVAGVALFLASPAAAFVTGTIVPVDGGYLIA